MATPQKKPPVAAKPAAAVPAATPAKPVKSTKPAKPAASLKPAKAAASLKPAKAAKTEKPAKPEKVKKPKAVRDSFTIPKTEYAVIDELKLRAAKAGTPAKKSELLRAGIKALAAMSEAAFLAALKAVPALKTGRPAKA